MILIDYGHEARELYSPTHAVGNADDLRPAHMAGPEASADTPPWLANPGEQDITAHVDFTSVRAAAEAEGLTTLGFLDQTYFLLGLLGALERSNPSNSSNLLIHSNLEERLALKTLLMPGGLGSTHKVLILGKGVGHADAPRLFLPDARHMNLHGLDWARPDGRVRSRDARPHRAVLVVEYTDRLDRIHPVRRRHRLAARAATPGSDRTPREFAFLALVSIPLWLVFEGYNLSSATGSTSGCPKTSRCGCSATRGRSRRSGRRFSKARSWLAVWRRAGRAGGAERPDTSAPCPACRACRFLALSIAVGAADAGVAPSRAAAVAPYMAAPVWLGFIFLLDPINARLGGESLLADLRAGSADRLINLALSGLLCGVLWEFWNYWSRAKWHYTVPIMENLKLFEMPVPGYLGFPAFALECFTMYVFVRSWCSRVADSAAHSRGRRDRVVICAARGLK